MVYGISICRVPYQIKGFGQNVCRVSLWYSADGVIIEVEGKVEQGSTSVE